MDHANDIRSRRDYLRFALVLIALSMAASAQQSMRRVAANAAPHAGTDPAIELLK